jgi:CheY-like chemotaxis protein
MADHKHIPIVLISASDEALKTYKEYGASSFLRKPFQPSQLLNVAASYFLTNS